MKGQGPARSEEIPEYRREQVGGQASHRGDPQGSGPAWAGCLPGLLPEHPPFFRHRNKIPPLGRQLNLAFPPATDEQCAVQILLQRAQMAAHRRLGDIQRLGGGGDVSQLCHCQKNLDPLLCHSFSSKI